MDESIFSINGTIKPAAEATIPVTDRGFLYGDGLFETLHVYGRKPFELDAHLERLRHGIEAFGFENVPSQATLLRWMTACIARANFTESNLRLIVTRGSGPRGPSIVKGMQPLVAIEVTSYKRRPESHYTQGVSAIVASFRRQESSVVANLKTMAYIEQIFARREADAAGVDEALLLNNSGLLCEGSASNITLVRNGGLVAPQPRLSGALPGTCQQFTLKLAQKLGLPVCEAALGPFDLKECEEAFLTGSLREITPLVKVDHYAIGNGKPGPITLRLIEAYRAHIEANCPGYRFPNSTVR